jgi:hypothetical protein
VEPKKLRSSEGPEAPIKRAIVKYLQERKWLVVVTHGNMFQSGLPDLYCAHIEHGQRWIEVKNPLKYHFTKAQMYLFPELFKHGVGVWVLVDATKAEYDKLWEPPNFHRFIGHSSVQPWH